MAYAASANLSLAPVAELPSATHVVPVGQDDEAVRAHVRALLSMLYPEGRGAERRRDVRYPFPFLVSLTPLGPHGLAPVGPDLVVAGKHLSERGLGFFHPGPLPHRRVLVTVDGPAGRRLRCVMDVSWCRFTRVGWYESGGRFLEVLSSEDQ